MKTNQQGFSLVELLIVVAITGILAAIAVPGLIKAKRASTEASAISSLRSYTSAQTAYFATDGKYSSYGEEADLLLGEYLDADFLTTGRRNSYIFTFNVTSDLKTYSATADPEEQTGDGRHYFVDESGVIRFTEGMSVTASVSSPPIN